MKLKRRYLFGMFWVLCFLVGSFVWKILHTGTFLTEEKSTREEVDSLDFSVYVGDYLVTRHDIEWEYAFYMNQLPSLAEQNKEQAKKKTSDKPVLELYNKILADLIERKLLYQFIASDSRFDRNEVSRYTRCLESLQSTVSTQPLLFDQENNKNRLRSLLCEKDILQQYLSERIVRNINLSDEEQKTYFLNHRNEFIEPQRVLIRQIVLPSELEAKKTRARLTQHNFEALAKELSIAPEAQKGGLLGPFAKGEMPSVFDVAFEMNPHEIQDLLKSTYGFHIIMLEKKFPKTELSFEQAKPKIQQVLRKQKEEAEYKKWVEMALNAVPIRSSRGF